MLLKNSEIYNIATKLLEHFQDNQQTLPIKLNFYLQKNMNTLVELAKEIETARQQLIQRYGKQGENATEYFIPPENIELLTQENNDLFNLEQEVNLYTISINELNDSLELTMGQINALMFMLE